MSSISLKTFSLLSHWGLTATSYMCVGQRTSKKLSHNSEHSKASLSPQMGTGRGARVCCCSVLRCQQRRVRPQKWAKIHSAARFFSLEVTDTFSLTPCARTPSAPCELLLALGLTRISWKSDLSSEEIRFSFQTRNLVSRSHKSISLNRRTVCRSAVWGLLAVSAFLTGGFGRREPRTRLLEGGRPAHNTRTRGLNLFCWNWG